MCIAIYKPVGKDLPSKKTLATCFSNNSDGAGYMYSYNGKVYIEKGLMTLTDFRTSIKSTLKILGVKASDLPMVLHFRITTQGGVQKELTHPFSMSDNYDDMKKLSNVCDIGVAHNGIIDFASSYSIKDHNDTMEFIKNVAYPLIKNNKNYYKSSRCMSILEYLLSGNRVVILDGDGHAELIGDWVEDKGIFYSNTTYKAKKYSYSSSWKTTSSYFESKEKVAKVYAKLSKSQINDLKTLHTIFCDKCGSDVVIDYDYINDKYIGTCLECGEEFEVDDEYVDIMLDYGLCDYCYGYYDDGSWGGYDYYGYKGGTR